MKTDQLPTDKDGRRRPLLAAAVAAAFFAGAAPAHAQLFIPPTGFNTQVQIPVPVAVPVQVPVQVPVPVPVVPSTTGRLIEQETISNPPLGAVEATLDNPSKEPIVARVYHLRSPGRGTEHRLRPGQAVDLVFDRDPGGVLRQVFEVRRFGGPIERRVVDTPIPPKSLYTIVVFAERTTYKYIDRTGKAGGLPNFNSASLVSLGVIPLPAGDGLADGAVLDLPQEAAARRNPGAAAAFEPPLPLLDQPAAREPQEGPPVAPPSLRDPAPAGRPAVGPPPAENPNAPSGAVPPPPAPRADDAGPRVVAPAPPPRPQLNPQPAPQPPPRPAPPPPPQAQPGPRPQPAPAGEDS